MTESAKKILEDYKNKERQKLIERGIIGPDDPLPEETWTLEQIEKKAKKYEIKYEADAKKKITDDYIKDAEKEVKKAWDEFVDDPKHIMMDINLYKIEEMKKEL